MSEWIMWNECSVLAYVAPWEEMVIWPGTSAALSCALPLCIRQELSSIGEEKVMEKQHAWG